MTEKYPGKNRNLRNLSSSKNLARMYLERVWTDSETGKGKPLAFIRKPNTNG